MPKSLAPLNDAGVVTEVYYAAFIALFLKPENSRRVRNSGAGDRDRTGDIQLGKLAFYR